MFHVMENMLNFQIKFQIQRAALTHLVTVYLPKAEKVMLRRLFDAIDVEKDGEIEMNEFI